jgi:pimeloyl-ACP methyl ester carboxylesterase
MYFYTKKFVIKSPAMQCLCARIKIYALLGGYLFSVLTRGHAQIETTFADTTGENLVDIGYHKLFVSQNGPRDTKFTIVFVSGAGGGSKDWTKVIKMLPPGIRTVAYDRAGAGKSEQGVLPETMAQEALELHTLLHASGIRGPLIIVGQSLGGLIARLYTERYEKNIVGIVLVDPTHESSVLGSMKYGGWVRLREKATGKPVPKPQLKMKISAGYDSTADYMAEEFQQMYLSAMKNPQALMNRPLIVIGAGIRNQPPGTPNGQWSELRTERDKQIRDLTSLSGNAKFILDPASGHSIQNDNPAIVAKSIQMIIHSIESKTKL